MAKLTNKDKIMIELGHGVSLLTNFPPYDLMVGFKEGSIAIKFRDEKGLDEYIRRLKYELKALKLLKDWFDNKGDQHESGRIKHPIDKT